MKNIYVGNLDFQATEDELRALFQAQGSIQAVTLVKDRDTGRSRGFAFVEMANDSEAEAAIRSLNGTLLHERQLSINEARPKRELLSDKTPAERRKRVREPLHTRAHREHRK
jgi:RNA recognition motif-containing protein